jgi:uncharacterized membrane protein
MTFSAMIRTILRNPLPRTRKVRIGMTTTLEPSQAAVPSDGTGETSHRSDNRDGHSHDTHGYSNVHPIERIASSLAGAALTTFAVSKRRDATGAAIAVAGGYLLYRGISGHCPGYAALRTGTAHDAHNENAVIPHGQGIKVLKTVTINRPASELYAFWRNFENLPKFMRHLESVTVLDDKRSHWVAKGPMGMHIAWDAEIINDEMDRLIAWKSVKNASVPNAGSVSFKPLPAGRGTEVQVNLEYNPPGGLLGAAVAKLWGEEPHQQVRDDLYRFKQLMETGVIATVEGQPQGNKERHTHEKPLMQTSP